MAIAPSPPIIEPSIEAEPDGLYEVVDGQVVEKPEMGAFEMEIAGSLFLALENHARSHRLGKAQIEMLFLIDPTHALKRRPDVSFISIARWPIQTPAPQTSAWDVVPDLAVEVVSPTNTAEAVLEKLEEYFQAGAQLVWVAYPRRRKVYVYESPTSVRILQVGDDLDGGAVLPGFRLSLAELFGEEGQPATEA